MQGKLRQWEARLNGQLLLRARTGQSLNRSPAKLQAVVDPGSPCMELRGYTFHIAVGGPVGLTHLGGQSLRGMAAGQLLVHTSTEGGLAISAGCRAFGQRQGSSKFACTATPSTSRWVSSSTSTSYGAFSQLHACTFHITAA